MSDLDYWRECISTAAEDLSLILSDDQLDALSKAASSGHEFYGMSFYSPPASDRHAEIERGWQAKYAALEKEFEQYRARAEKAVKRALPDRVYPDSRVSINERGEVYEHGGRTERVL